ncbi:hypothetical protein [Actinokineospora sp. NBRC 105648]|uniref:hypothetical protein n=1 Tax=Actinokineospora sp. NBRC 105648 TaxID=3032206 RepID=UPI0024A4E85A|nr:hypothetical protein [Actinokineospora sp. NBRC 105648]GLZ39583.1 hypothetical protein Acsp05_32070 [Actinokineospora sp. NBRC 105648]
MTGFFSRLLSGVPKGFTGRLDRDEAVAASAEVRGGGFLVATSLGLWVPGDDGPRRIGWHLVSKAAWAAGVFTITEADEAEQAGAAVVLVDRPPIRVAVEAPGKLPQAVHRRVTGSIRSRHHRELPGGGAWFVQRKVPGRDGTVLQVRPDEGTELDVVRAIAHDVAEKMGQGLAES